MSKVEICRRFIDWICLQDEHEVEQLLISQQIDDQVRDDSLLNF